MPLVPQQDIIVVGRPFASDNTQEEAAEKLRRALDAYPPCRIISITGSGNMHSYALTAVVETV